MQGSWFGGSLHGALLLAVPPRALLVHGLADLAAGDGTGVCPPLLCRKLKDAGFIALSMLARLARLP